MEVAMINKVTIVNSYGEELTMALRNPELSGYAITNISGLEPVKVDIKMTQLVSGLKYKYNKGFFKSREIKLDVLYYEDNNLLMGIEDLRNRLYTYLKNNDLVTVYFEKDDEIYAIQGYPSAHDSTIFSKSCSCQVSITCPDPWFHKHGLDFKNEDESRTTTLEENSRYYYSNNALVNYDGDMGNGFILETETDIRNLAGKRLTLECSHPGDNTVRTLDLTIPYNYGSQLSPASLFIDFTGDSLKVYSGHDKDLGYGAVGLYLDYDQAEQYYIEESGLWFKDINDRIWCIRSLTGNDYIYGPTDTTPESARSVYLLSTDDARYDPLDRNSVPDRITVKALAVDEYDYTARTNDDVITNGQLYDLYPLYDDSTGAIWLVIYVKEGIKELWIQNGTGTSSATCIQFGILESDFHADPTYTRDGIGWVEANSITQRGELPRLYPGINNITFNTKDNDIAIKYTIKYNTLTRGL